MDSAGERDQTVERLLRQTLKTPPVGGPAEACLDSETLAAWADGGLSDSVLDAVQIHVADCARCQDLAGTLARIRSAVPPAETVHSSRRWLAWFAPLAAAAAALAIWFAVPGKLGGPVNNRDVALLRETTQAPIDAQNKTVLPAANEPSPPPSVSRRELPAAPPRDRQTAGALEERAKVDALQPSAPEKKAEQESARGDLAKDRAVAQPSAVTAAPAATPAPPAAAAPQPERFRAGAAARAANAAALDIVSPDPAIRWRIVGAAVQHSANGGSTWDAVPVGVPAELTAGAAPAATVCWLVGRVGVVLLTTDGRTWRRVPFPEMTDLSSVFTVDAGGRVASVSTADGRTFVTTDAGASWAPR